MSLLVKVPGALTTVQDAGRFGYFSAGITQNGVMDADAYARANRLVGNSSGEAVLEATLFGFSIVFTEQTLFALTGADMQPKFNGAPAAMNTALRAKSGDTLTLALAQNGCRCYLAIAGGIDVPEVMGSRSTNLKCGFGGFQGRKLAAGDTLPTLLPTAKQLRRAGKSESVPPYDNCITLRVVEGPQADAFTEAGRKTFFTSCYTVSQQSDRMGCRLEGDAIESICGVDIISDGITCGSVQVPASGTPIILLSDRQTTGGYAKIGTVISTDLPKLAQCMPGASVRFESISVEDAQALYRIAHKPAKLPFWKRLFG